MTHIRLFFISAGILFLVGLLYFGQNLNFGSDHTVTSFGLRSIAKGEGPSEYLKEQFIQCIKKQPKSWRSPCFKELADLLSQQFSFSESLAALMPLETQPGIAEQCHTLVHSLAQNEYKRTKSVPETFSECKIVCGEGCYHGAVEGFILSQGLAGAGEDKMVKAIANICEPVKNGVAAIYGHCVHGLGHALMLVTNLDVPRSLAVCDGLAHENERIRCYGGVFMENTFSADPVHPPPYIHPDDPLYPCTDIAEKYKENCFSAQATYWFSANGMDWKRMVDFCGDIPKKYQFSCFVTMGANAVPLFRNDQKKLKEICDYAP